MQTYAHTCTHTHTYEHICAHTHTRARIRTRTDTDAHICANMRTYAECGREVHVAGFIIHVSCCAFNRKLSGAFFFFFGVGGRGRSPSKSADPERGLGVWGLASGQGGWGASMTSSGPQILLPWPRDLAAMADRLDA